MICRCIRILTIIILPITIIILDRLLDRIPLNMEIRLPRVLRRRLLIHWWPEVSRRRLRQLLEFTLRMKLQDMDEVALMVVCQRVNKDHYLLHSEIRCTEGTWEERDEIHRYLLEKIILQDNLNLLLPLSLHRNELHLLCHLNLNLNTFLNFLSLAAPLHTPHTKANTPP